MFCEAGAGDEGAGPAARSAGEPDAAASEKGQETTKRAARGRTDWPQSLAPSPSLLSRPELQLFDAGCGRCVAVAPTAGASRLAESSYCEA